MTEATKIVLRSPVAADRNFVLSTWLKGQRWGDPQFSVAPHSTYFREHSERIVQILATPGVRLTIACDKDNPEWIVGFAVFRGPELFWMHVRPDYRRQGIGWLLLDGQDITTVRGWTRLGAKIAKDHGFTLKPLLGGSNGKDDNRISNGTEDGTEAQKPG